jgi:hypothetical protein
MWVVAIDQAAASCGVRLWMWKKAVRQNNYGFLKIYEPTPRVIHSTSHSTLFLSHWLVDPLVSTFFFLGRIDRQEELAVLYCTWLLEWAHDSIFMLPVAGNTLTVTQKPQELVVSTFFFLGRIDRQEELAVLCCTWLLEWAHDFIFMLPVAGNTLTVTQKPQELVGALFQMPAILKMIWRTQSLICEQIKQETIEQLSHAS